MPDNKLSDREAALIAQARAQLGKTSSARAGARAAAAMESVTPDAFKPGASERAAPASALHPAERIAALMAEAHAETGRRRRRQRQLYVWAPVAFISIIGLWTLLWMWHKL